MTPEQLAKSGTEHGEQMALFAHFVAERNAGRYLQTETMFAIPNGGKRDIRTAAKLKAEGVKAGVSDIFLPVARGPYHGLFVELKRLKEKPTKEQLDFGGKMMQAGFGFNVVEGWINAAALIKAYLNQGV